MRTTTTSIACRSRRSSVDRHVESVETGVLSRFVTSLDVGDGCLWLQVCWPPATLDLEASAVRCYTATSRTNDAGSTSDSVLVATEGGLLQFDFDGKLRRKWTRAEGLAGHTLLELEILPSGDVWIASAQGVVRLHKNRPAIYTVDEGLNDERTYAVTSDAQNRLFVGTHRGVNLLEGDRFVPFNDTHEFSRRPTYDIHAATDGTMWFAKENALTQYLGDGRWRVFQRDPVVPGPRSDIPSNSVRHVVTDDLGHPWIGTSNRGLGYFDENKWRHLFHRERDGNDRGLRDNRIAALALDSEGGLWVGHGDSEVAGSYFGVGRLYEEEWTYFTTEDGLPDNRVYRVRVEDGNAWIATARGAASYSDGRFHLFHSAGELPSNGVIEIVRVAEGRVAVHTSAGKAMFERGRAVAHRPSPDHVPHPAARMPKSPPTDFEELGARVTLPGSDDLLWVGTRRRGLLRWDGRSWTQLLLHGRPLPMQITSLCFEDNAGTILWVGTAAEGALRIDLRTAARPVS